MDDKHIAFKGRLQQLVEKVERGEMIPKLQASHAPPCKFWTVFQVLNGIRHMAPVINGPNSDFISEHTLNRCYSSSTITIFAFNPANP